MWTNRLLLPQEKTFHICWETSTGRKYTFFADHHEFLEFFFKTPEEQRCFYEVIHGNFPHRFYLDIDINGSEAEVFNENIEENVLNSVIDASRNLFSDLDLNRDVLIFTSHGREKKSFHIVFQRVVENNKQAKACYLEIVKNIPFEFRKFLDKLYKKVQQFRTLGSHKLKCPDRPKRFESTWRYKNTLIHNPVTDPFSKSFVSVIPDDAQEITQELKERLKRNITGEYIKPDTEIKDKFIRYIEEVLTEFKIPRDSLKIREIKDEYILLDNVKPYICPICQRMHNKENPYIICDNISAYFCCRRTNLFLEIYGEDKGKILTKTPTIRKTMKDEEEIH